MPVLAGVGIVGSAIGGLLGSSGASSAGRTVGAAGTAVGNSVNNATGGAINAGYTGLADASTNLGRGWEQIGNTNNLQSQLYNNTSATLQPYQQAGVQGVQGMQSLLGNYTPFSYNPQDVSNDPAYKFEQQQGMQALQSQAAAAGMLQSGANMKGIANYTEGLASTFENQDYQQALGTYQTNFSNQMQGLNTLAGYGQNANQTQAQLALGYGNQAGQTAGLSTALSQAGASDSLQGNQWIGSTGLQGAEAAGNFYMGGANGTAAGQAGAANAWGSALNGIGSQLGGMGTLLSNPYAGLGGNTAGSSSAPGSYLNWATGGAG